jgi:hypothetical protein
LFKIHQGTRISLALKRCPCHEVLVDTCEYGVNTGELVCKILLICADARSFAFGLSVSKFLADSSDPFVQMVQKGENSLFNLSADVRDIQDYD